MAFEVFLSKYFDTADAPIRYILFSFQIKALFSLPEGSKST
jgi:hypothetical protein